MIIKNSFNVLAALGTLKMSVPASGKRKVHGQARFEKVDRYRSQHQAHKRCTDKP